MNLPRSQKSILLPEACIQNPDIGRDPVPNALSGSRHKVLLFHPPFNFLNLNSRPARESIAFSAKPRATDVNFVSASNSLLSKSRFEDSPNRWNK
jgi:hypothetical protein